MKYYMYWIDTHAVAAKALMELQQMDKPRISLLSHTQITQMQTKILASVNTTWNIKSILKVKGSVNFFKEKFSVFVSAAISRNVLQLHLMLIT